MIPRFLSCLRLPHSFFLLAVLYGCAAGVTGAQQLPTPAPTLTIVPTDYGRDVPQEPDISFGRYGHFHVLLFNPSSTPLTLFQEWNSWGYFGLSFDVTYPNGRHAHVAKKARGWDKNFPATLTVAPYGYYVFNVEFADLLGEPVWDNLRPEDQGFKEGLRCRVRAVYTIEPSHDSRRAGVWSGTIASEEGTYHVWP